MLSPTPFAPPLPPPVPAPARPVRARRPLRWWSWRLVVLAVAAVISSRVEPGAIFVIPFLFVIVVPFEKLFPRHRQPLRRPGLGTDLAYGVAQPLLGTTGVVLGAVIGLLSLAWLPGLALRPLVDALPPLGRALLGVLLFDVLTYWVHRWSHEVPFLWRFHAVHHSTAHLDWVSGLRAHPFDGALLAPPFVLLLAAGFSAEQAGILAVVQVVTGIFLHANVRWRWRALQRIVVTPEFHHWHHVDDSAAHHTNYAVLLPVWDIVFGTYRVPRDRRPDRYGVTPPLPEGIVAQLRHPTHGLPSLRWVLRHPWHAARRLRRALGRGLRQVVRTTHRSRPASR